VLVRAASDIGTVALLLLLLVVVAVRVVESRFDIDWVSAAGALL